MAEGSRPTNLVSALLPKTLAGLAVYLVIFAAGMAASGVALFAFYQYRVSSLEQRLLNFNAQFDSEYSTKTDEFESLVSESKAAIEKAAEGVGSKSNELKGILEKISPSIARVEGNDINGDPAVGTAFIVSSTQNDAWLITSFSVVAGSISKEEEVSVTLGASKRSTTVYSWDEERDLALIVLRVGNQAVLSWATGTPELGIRVWGVSAGAGSFGAAATEGNLLDATSEAILSDVDVPSHSRGAPLIDIDGKVLGVLSLSYAPPGFQPSNGWAVPIRLSCAKVLRCPN
jgi:serine protease Do